MPCDLRTRTRSFCLFSWQHVQCSTLSWHLVHVNSKKANMCRECAACNAVAGQKCSTKIKRIIIRCAFHFAYCFISSYHERQVMRAQGIQPLSRGTLHMRATSPQCNTMQTTAHCNNRQCGKHRVHFRANYLCWWQTGMLFWNMRREWIRSGGYTKKKTLLHCQCLCMVSSLKVWALFSW